MKKNMLITIAVLLIIALSALLIILLSPQNTSEPITPPDDIIRLTWSRNNLGGHDDYHFIVEWNGTDGYYTITGAYYDPAIKASVSCDRRRISDEDRDILLDLLKKAEPEPYEERESNRTCQPVNVFEIMRSDSLSRYFPPQGEAGEALAALLRRCVNGTDNNASQY